MITDTKQESNETQGKTQMKLINNDEVGHGVFATITEVEIMSRFFLSEDTLCTALFLKLAIDCSGRIGKLVHFLSLLQLLITFKSGRTSFSFVHLL